MASKLNKGGGPQGGGQAARIAETKARAGKYQDYFTPPVIPNLKKAEDEAKNAMGQGRKSKRSEFPQGIFHMGHFIPPDSRDSFMETLEQITTNQNGPSTKYGVINTTADQVVPYIRKKKDNAWYLNNLRTAEYLVDPSDPKTVKGLYAIYPELKEVPDQWYQDMVAVQWSLKELLQFGEIRSKDDHALVMHICAPGFVIPRYPAWDPMGIIIENTDGYKGPPGNEQSYRQKIAEGFKKSNWNPFRYSTEGKDPALDPANTQDTQIKWKSMILRRLYPGLRDKSDTKLMDIVTNGLFELDGTTGEPGKEDITNNMMNKPNPIPRGMYTGV